jgi:hypothetical protein
MRSYAMKPKKVCEISLRFQLLNTIPTHFHSFKTTTKCPFYFPSSYHLPRPIFFSLFKKVVRTIFSRFKMKITSGERESPQWSESAIIVFQWYKKLFESMGFDLCNRVLKIRESIWNSNSHNGSSLGSVRVHSLTFFALLKACDVTPRLPLLLTTL